MRLRISRLEGLDKPKSKVRQVVQDQNDTVEGCAVFEGIV
jgi:hypothetical protein